MIFLEQLEFKNENEKIRIDICVFNFFKKNELNYSRVYIQRLIENGLIKNNDKIVVKKNLIISANDEINVQLVNFDDSYLVPKKIDFEIIYEDEHIIVINKPNNLSVHPGNGNNTDTLVNGLLYYFKELSNLGGSYRPGIVHRIDKFTTGLVVVAKNNIAHAKLSEDFKNRNINKEYIALIKGVLEEENGEINAPIGRSQLDRKKMTVTEINSKNAITKFSVMQRFKNATLVKVKILTGRTHQIRVHFEYIKHPIIGDPIYSNRSSKKNEFGQYLHAYKLEFNHPITNKKNSFLCELPNEFNDKIKEMDL